MKQGIQEFHRTYVLIPADKAANNIVVVCRLHYINTLKQELKGTKSYKETSTNEKTVVNSHSNDLPYKFAVNVKERQDKRPTMYWLPKALLTLTPRPVRDLFATDFFATDWRSMRLVQPLYAHIRIEDYNHRRRQVCN